MPEWVIFNSNTERVVEIRNSEDYPYFGTHEKHKFATRIDETPSFYVERYLSTLEANERVSLRSRIFTKIKELI